MERTILIIEDDFGLTEDLRHHLNSEGHQVVSAKDWNQALETGHRYPPALIVLGDTLPATGIPEVCRTLRTELKAPILLMAEKGVALDGAATAGADGCLLKPFAITDFLARVRAMLHPAQLTTPPLLGEPPPLALGNLEINPAKRRAKIDGSPLALTPKEFDLLAFLCGNPGTVFSREQLLEKVWRYEFAGTTRTVDVHIRWLRKKIEANPANPTRIITVRHRGYKLEG